MAVYSNTNLPQLLGEYALVSAIMDFEFEP